ncbi:MAG TPA: carboxypeptidase M32 [Anaerolineales bacterium]|nr:carboxypeptidase M32 [Anaerolineales bacterium]
MNEKLVHFKEIMAEVADLKAAAAVLSWDQQVNMPPGGAEARGNQLATLSRLAHQAFTTDEVGKLLEALRSNEAALSPDEAAMVRVAGRDFDKATRVPSSFVAELAVVSTQAHEAWVEARKKSDFPIFRPHLEKVVELTHKYISFFPPADHPYDVLLDDYEPGMKTAEVTAIFDSLRPPQVRLIRQIAQAKQVRDAFLHKKFDERKLWDFGVEVVSRFGYDWERGRQDKAAHPFETSFSVNDVRITTRFEADHPLAILFSTMHEAGHGMYEQGNDPSYERTPLHHGASLAVHESQSRLWENLVGRSLPFWRYFFPRLKRLFPSQLGNVDLRTFYKAINKVEPSLIRVNADEATYNLHIMLRLELEIAMVDGQLAVKDLPQIWNEKMKEYLGIVPPNDALGVLQDIHWSGGMLGYFSTYALGNLISLQLWEKIRRDIPDLDEQFRRGKFEALLAWLHANVHQHGRRHDPQELVQRVTGSKITPEPYVRYLTEKYSDIYEL